MDGATSKLSAGLGWRPSLTTAWTLVYGFSLYLILSLRGRLLPEGQLDWIDAKRGIAVAIGTGFFWLAIRVQKQRSDATLPVRIGLGLAFAVAAGVLLLGVRVALTKSGWQAPTSLSEELRWLITWLGYSLAWIGFFIAAVGPAAAPGVDGPPSPAEVSADALEHDEIWVQRNQQRWRIAVDAIEWIEAEGNYARVHSRDGSGILRISLAKLERRLDSATFIRVHRSMICRRDAIVAVERLPSRAYCAILRSGDRIPVGRQFGAALLAKVHRSISEADGTDAHHA